MKHDVGILVSGAALGAADHRIFEGNNAMTPDEVRQIKVAQWHAQEAITKAAMGDFDLEFYHVDAGCEFVALVTGRKPRCNSGDELIAECLRIVDASNVVFMLG